MRAFKPLVVVVAGAFVACSEPAVLQPDGDQDAVLPTALDDEDGVPAPFLCHGLPPADDPLEVQTKTATVRGSVHDDDDSVWVWKGVRYAAPPVGDLRFRPAAPAACETEMQDARSDPPQCPQLGADFDVVTGSEDCLFLNVFRPERRDDESLALLPVLFFIHGGGEIMGSGHQPAGVGNLYDGARLARESQAVVVSINYRLGALGFLAHPALARDGVVGNWAHHDVLAALQWTQDNIAGFGGDPAKVAIFGESAGAHNVCVMLASEKARGLFSSAIMESGGCEVAPRHIREQEGVDVAAAVGCSGDDDDVAACLRSKDPGAFLRIVPPVPPMMHVWWLPFGSTVDGDVLKEQPLETIGRGAHNHVPFIAGSNAEETNLFLAVDGALTCFDLRLQFDLLLGSSFPDDATKEAALDDIMETYACGDHLIVRDVLIEASTDLEFTCQARRVTRAMTANQSEPVWRYHFRDRANFGAFMPLGAFHAWELFYVFDSFDTGLYLASDGERDLARLLQRMWGRMARDGNPNGGLPGSNADIRWPALARGVDDVMAFDEDPFAAFGGAVDVGMDADPAPECDLWDRLLLDAAP
ncbi:MAG: carboxylesterase family protein [Deltaproteobacteria bacterium]|nr:carboxylesterase family protein [Deltaproteobacteria bacterium]